MGKEWDDFSDNQKLQAWTQEWATEALRVAKPGATMLCFGGTRTFHRIACGIEDAGWEIRDTMTYIYGSGFPKSHNLQKAMQKKGVEEADTWDGWGTALKPAWEPIILAMKPRDGTFVNNALKWGVAGLNIDGGRVPTNGEKIEGMLEYKNENEGWDRPWKKDKELVRKRKQAAYDRANQMGRWPANLTHDGSEEVVSEFGNGAARFFYCAKASRKERNAGLEGMPVLEKKTLNDYKHNSIGRTAPKSGSPMQNNHPTVKPLSLMEYLCRLTSTPTGGVVLDPFMGSGTTGMACRKTGRDFVGIELDEHYMEIAEKRIASVKQQELI